MNFNVFDDIDPIAAYQVPNYASRYASETFKALDPNKVHTIYRDNKPLARSQSTPWMTANPASFNDPNPGPRAVTIIGWKVDGSNSTQAYGTIRVTWYITFRG